LPDSYANGNTDSYSNEYAYGNTDCNCNGNTDSYSNEYAYGNTDSYAYGNTDSYAYGNTDVFCSSFEPDAGDDCHRFRG
jgi:hypothetical protein